MQTRSLTESLNPAPESVVGPDGKPRFGTYQGTIPQVDWRGLSGSFARPSLWRRLHHKRWHYAGLATPECFIGLVVVDVGWATTAFAYLFDRQRRQVVGSCSAMGLPGVSGMVGAAPGAGAHAFFWGLGCVVRIERSPGSDLYRIKVHSPQLRVDAELSAAEHPPVLAVIAPITDGVANCTHKVGSMPLRGSAIAKGQRYDLSGGCGALDHTSGLLARDTHWRWASAHSPAVGINLQAGFNGETENALWLDGQLIRLGAARFDFNTADPMRPWRITTDDGLVDLTFQPEGLRREDKDLGVAISRYVQPVGTFSGTVRAQADAPPVTVENLLGVTEDHTSRW